jgi:hypothetical protein
MNAWSWLIVALSGMLAGELAEIFLPETAHPDAVFVLGAAVFGFGCVRAIQKALAWGVYREPARVWCEGCGVELHGHGTWDTASPYCDACAEKV